MFAIAQDDGSSPARHFVFAAILYLGAAILIASVGLNWKLAVEHGDLIDFAVMGGIFLTAAYDRFIHSRFY